jgi:hypothetical protein
MQMFDPKLRDVSVDEDYSDPSLKQFRDPIPPSKDALEPDPTSPMDFVGPGELKALAKLGVGGLGGLGMLPAGIMKYGPNVTNLADIAKSPYSKLFDTLNRQTHRTYWTNEIPMDVSTPAIIKGKKLPFYEEYRDIPGTGGYSMDPENFKLAGLQAEGHPSGSIIATRGNERDAGTLQHEMMHNVIDLTARDKPFPDIDPAREAKSERMLEAIYGKSEHDKDTLRGATSNEIGRAFKEISDEKLRNKVYDEIGSRYGSKVRGDRDR